MSWAALPPEVARADLLGFAYLGTLRADGRPRISPVEAHVWEGELLIGVMPRSLKARDLARDSRCTLQCLVREPDSGEPELKLYCRAVGAEGEPPGAWWTGRPAADARVYALEIEEAALVEWNLGEGEMTVTSWSPEQGTRRRTAVIPDLVVWLASSCTYVVCVHTCPSAESRREFGIGADDCVSSQAGVCRRSSETPARRAEQKRCAIVELTLHCGRLAFDGTP